MGEHIEPTGESTRYSRDGDQFHYLWAARRCLRLLSPQEDLIAVAIEGVSPDEHSSSSGVTPGVKSIDVAEYWGSEIIEEATKIRYTQLKHTTVRLSRPWPPSELKNTIQDFAKFYISRKQELSDKDLANKLEFWFISNRPINSKFLRSINDAAVDTNPKQLENLEKLKEYTGLSGRDLALFCKLLHLDGNQEDYVGQRKALFQEVRKYLPGPDVDAPIQLKELVTEKALSEYAYDPVITKMDVLRCFKADEHDLFPAKCLIEHVENVVPREQEHAIVNDIIQSDHAPILIHAAGGVGKSVFSTCIGKNLPKGSISVLYDCFGNGQYRNVSRYRHRHKEALVQIANELAQLSLCHPLIPSPNSDSSAYTRAFIYRLEQSIGLLKEDNPEALICIIIDAADNAQLAAEEAGDQHSFARDLLRETMPPGVRLVMLCRTHRRQYLDSPPYVTDIELKPFSQAETTQNLQRVFPEASTHDAVEFHHLSSSNPRVQGLALSQATSLREMLLQLGPTPTAAEDIIKNLLDKAIAKLRDATNKTEKKQIDLICAGLAILRPFVPISVLASMSKVDESMVESFVHDLGQPLRIIDRAVQFFDEPAETWFKDSFKPEANDLENFINRLVPLSSTSPYIASTLPQLMLEAGQTSQLVNLALESKGLPEDNPVEKRNIELQRLQFALKACLREERYTDAVKLAMKGGRESAGNERQISFLQENTDLSAIFLGTDYIQKLSSQQNLESGWTGSHNVYEASLMSWQPNLLGEARSRLRVAEEWLQNWSRMSPEDRKNEDISVSDIAEMAVAHFNIHGAKTCARDLCKWTPSSVIFEATRIVAQRCINHGKYDELNKLTIAAQNNLGVILACTIELREVGRAPPKSVVGRALRLIQNPEVKAEVSNMLEVRESRLLAIVSLVEAACVTRNHNVSVLVSVLDQYLLPTTWHGSEFGYDLHSDTFLRAQTLRATLMGEEIQLIEIAPPNLRKEMEKNAKGSKSRELQNFLTSVGTLLPWHKLFVAICTGQICEDQLEEAINRTKSESSNVHHGYYSRIGFKAINEAALVWVQILLETGGSNDEIVRFNQWISSLERPLFTPVLTKVSRMTAHKSQLQSISVKYANKVFQMIENQKMSADEKIEIYVELARAVLAASKSESAAYFDKAIEVASRTGDENLDRWHAILDIADQAANDSHSSPEVAYKISRCAELTYEYVAKDKHFDWDATVETITDLCPSSSLAILSRWRDRRFGWFRRLLPICVQRLTEKNQLDPKVALPLFCFRTYWEPDELLKNALSACSNNDEKKTALAFLYRYLTLSPQQSASTWEKIKAVATSHELAISNLNQLIKFHQHSEQSHQNQDGSIGQEDILTEKDRNWEEIFQNLDLSKSSDITTAFQRFRATGALYFPESLFREAINHVDVGKEADFILAVAEIVDLYEFRHFLDAVPESWTERLATKNALSHGLELVCQKHCLEITKNRYYEPLPIKKACALSGRSEIWLIDKVLQAIGKLSDPLDSSRLFSLVGLLVPMLSEAEALDAVSYSLDLLEEELEDQDGDGPWVPTLNPPSDVHQSLAGYIWAALASPETEVRWEAAHVVRGLCSIGCNKMLGRLVALANANICNPFVDPALHFYDMHAKQWLLIALARVAHESPTTLIPYSEFLVNQALNNQHVLIRSLAAEAALTLENHGAINLSPGTQHRMLMVNIAQLEPQPSNEERPIDNQQGQSSETNKDRFFFGIDIGPYWFEPLARLFGISQFVVEDEAVRVICGDWNHDEDFYRDGDTRTKRGIFHEQETWHSHGSLPETDNLRFYLSYHAMMVVAGKLLETTPLASDYRSTFTDWLHEHSLARLDGRWLADRRDSAPLDWPNWKNKKPADDEWCRPVKRKKFVKTIKPRKNKLVLWGDWVYVSGDRKESTSIRSALVSSGNSLALLRALQTASNPHDYCIPSADDSLQIDHNEFQLKGWVVAREQYYGLDDKDPWAAKINYPATRPAGFVAQKMGLRPGSEQRIWWRQQNRNEHEVLWSQVWSHYRRPQRDHEPEPEQGGQFSAEFGFMLELLHTVDMDLLVSVEIKRRYTYSHYDKREEGKTTLLPAPEEVRLFIIRSNGDIHAI